MSDIKEPFLSFLTQEIMIFLAISFALMLYYLAYVVQKPRLIYRNPELRSFLIKSIPTLTNRYWPTAWCFQSHLNTLIGIFFRGLHPALKYSRETIPTPDGGRISLDWYNPDMNAEILAAPDLDRPIVIFLPGITGHSHAEYLRSLIPVAHKIGYRVVALNYRGLDGNDILTPKVYNAATDEDLRTALKHIRDQVGCKTTVVGAGISMGGSVLAGYLASTGTESQVDAAFLISPCWDFIAGSHNLEKGFMNRQLNAYLTKGLINVVINHRKVIEDHMPDVFDMEFIRKCRTLRNFDNAFSRKMFNFTDCDDYYTHSSHKDKIGRIQVPTFVINAADDMIHPEKDIPMAQVAQSSHVAMLVTARGGHIGFMDGLVPNPWSQFYLERLMRQYLTALYNLPENPRNLLC